MFIKKASISQKDLLIRPEIRIKFFELFLPIYLTSIFFFQVALTFVSLLTSSSILSTRLFFMQAIELLASRHILSLLQSRLTSINSALLLKSKSELPLYSVTQIDCLGVSVIASGITEFKCAMQNYY